MIIMRRGVHYPAMLKLLHQQRLFTQTDLLTVDVALQASDCKECLVPVQEAGVESFLLCRKCVPVKDLCHQVKELHKEVSKLSSIHEYGKGIDRIFKEILWTQESQPPSTAEMQVACRSSGLLNKKSI